MAKDKSIPSNLVFTREKFKYDTIEDMRNDVALKIGDVVELNGYYEAGDGADHKRKIEAQDDGSGVMIKNVNDMAVELTLNKSEPELYRVGLYANIVHNGEVNVSWFGAKGDGVTDEVELFKKIFNYLSSNEVKLSLQQQKHYKLDNTLNIENFNSNLCIDGNNATLDITTSQKLGWWSRNGNCLIIKANEIKKLTCNIKNLNLTYERYEHTDTTTKENCNGFGGIGIFYFYNINVDNVKQNYISFSSGLNCRFYKFLQIKNVEFNNCGRKFLPTQDYSKQYDGPADAIILSNFKNGAVSIIENIRANSWENKYGRCGITIQNSDTATRHLCKITNFYFERYNRFIHQEDEGATVFKISNGEIKDCSIGFFSVRNTKGSKFEVNNVNYSNGALATFGSNGGIVVDYNSTLPVEFNLSNCNIEYNNSTQTREKKSVYNNCVFKYLNDSIIISTSVDVVYSLCKFNFNSESNQHKFYTNSIVKFINSEITGVKLGHKAIRVNDGKLLLDTTKIINNTLFIENNAGTEFDFINSKFYYNKANSEDNCIYGGKTLLNLKNCSFVNDTDQVVYIYGDGQLKVKNIYNCEFKNVRLDILNTSDVIPFICNTLFTVDSLSTLPSFFRFYSSKFYMSSCKFEQKNGTTTYPTPNSTNYLIRDCVVYQQDGTPIFLDSITTNIQQLNTPYHAEKMKQENVYDDYISYMDEKTAYDKQQRKLEQDRQLSYEEALKENPELTYEEFMSVQPMTLNLVEEPQPSEDLKKFMKKYL